MEDLYRRMEGAITKLRRHDDIELTKLIMAWTTHSRRPLRADELLQALQPEHSNVLDLRRTIDQLCGHFVEIDSNNYVTLVHYTAREYLINKSSIPFLLAPEDAHEELFRKTLSLYMHRSVRRMTDREILPPFYEEVLFRQLCASVDSGFSEASSIESARFYFSEPDHFRCSAVGLLPKETPTVRPSFRSGDLRILCNRSS